MNEATGPGMNEAANERYSIGDPDVARRAARFYPPLRADESHSASTHDGGYIEPEIARRAVTAVAEEAASLRVMSEDYQEVGTLMDLGELYAALARAQATFEPIVKNRTAKITPREKPAYSFDFADLDAVLASTRPSLAREGIAVLAPPSHRAGENGATVTLRTVIARGAARIILTTTFWYEGDIKAYGAAVTYHRRYVYNGALNLSADADADDGPSANETGGFSAPRQAAPQARQAAPEPRPQAKAAPAARASQTAPQATTQPAGDHMARIRAEQTRLGHFGDGKNPSAILAKIISEVIFDEQNRPKKPTQMTAADTEKLINHLKTLRTP
jgi:hypothetical protein